jgi:hypothetical protein
MVMYGGYDNKNQILSETYFLDLESMSWSIPRLAPGSEKLKGLSHLSVTAVFPASM